MSVALTERSTSPSQKVARSWAWKQILPWFGMFCCLALLVAKLAYDQIAPAMSTAGPATAGEVDTGGLPTEAPGSPRGPAQAAVVTNVTLGSKKLEAARIEIESPRMERLSTEVGVVGRIEANSDRRVDIRPRAPGIVREVNVLLGQSVKKGDPLVTLDSPEVGTARLNLRARQRELATARFEADWKSQIAATVAQIIPEIRKGVDPAEIEKAFADRPLGTYRASLLAAYANYDIAAHEEQKTTSLRSERLVGEHPAIVARHQREGVQATLESTIEQVRFDAAQDKRVSDQMVKRAEADVIDAAQRLRILGVSENVHALLAQDDKIPEVSIEDDVTRYQIVAPFDGTIIAKSAVPSQKADLIDPLFTLADLSNVWVTANIPEADVAHLPEIRGGTIRLAATAYPEATFEAKLLSVGAMVDPQTRTVPVLAETPNAKGLLKLGMFVRIELGSQESEFALTVPSSAVVEVDGISSVFLPVEETSEGKTFRLRPIEAGETVGDRVVVRSGLTRDDRVVSRGAYLVKSEMILQNEADEE
jgi:RND family efflux transporter MFP subunit